MGVIDFNQARARKQLRDRSGKFAGHVHSMPTVTLTTEQEFHQARREHELSRLLNLGTNLLGEPLNDDAKARILDLYRNPSNETWDAAHNTLVRRDMTVWNALLEYTDYDVTSGPKREIVTEGMFLFTETVYRTVGGWEKLPTTEQVGEAIAYAIHYRDR